MENSRRYTKRELRALVWNKRGQFGKSNVQFVLRTRETFNHMGHPKEEEYGVKIMEMVSLMVKDDEQPISVVYYDGVHGNPDYVDTEFGVSPQTEEVLNDVRQLVGYFDGLKAVVEPFCTVTGGVVHEEIDLSS